jgi:nitroimidazol reductase NimA-like FMN-containing flavoprotein (pyridoxamine 5'-phosphate oxidase superfamily)
MGETTGYRNHPQLDRFQKTSDPAGSLSSYLLEIYRESQNRDFRFDPEKIRNKAGTSKIKVTRGQLEFELDHLKKKLKGRDESKYKEIMTTRTPKTNPIFIITEGDIESWEKGRNMKKIPINKTQGKVDVPERLRTLNKKQRHAVLATDGGGQPSVLATDGGGQPYTSLMAFALTPDLEGILLATPRKTAKYRNMMKNKNVSLMIDTRSNSAEGYMRSEAVTILGTAGTIRKGKKRDELAGVLIEKHPELKEFVNSVSTALVLVAFDKVIHVGKFQTVTEWQKEEE